MKDCQFDYHETLCYLLSILINNKDLHGCRTLTTFYLLTAQLVVMYGCFSRIEEFFF